MRTCRCYDPRRMSSAATRIQQALGRATRAVTWTVVLAVLAAGGAGLVGQAWHAPGSPARAELTHAGDAALDARLDDATARLTEIAVEVERLADEAKIALEEVASSDPTRLRESLQRGGQAASTIDIETRELRDALADLPGDGPAAVLEYSNATLVRRSAILAAIDAALSLAAQWRQVAARVDEVANLTALIAQHDTTVLDAAARGRERAYREATAILDQALLVVADVQSARARLIAGSEQTVLDEWIQRNGDYDRALRALYEALERSGGQVTVEVQSARRGEQVAFAQLPPDRRTIIVIVSEVTRGGLTQAVVAIEDAHGRIEDALAEAA
jgi:tetratricopeptide (TPR) repeat protein